MKISDHASDVLKVLSREGKSAMVTSEGELVAPEDPRLETKRALARMKALADRQPKTPARIAAEENRARRIHARQIRRPLVEERRQAVAAQRDEALDFHRAALVDWAAEDPATRGPRPTYIPITNRWKRGLGVSRRKLRRDAAEEAARAKAMTPATPAT